MGKLIDSDTTKKALKECGLWFVADISCDIIDNQPAVDAIPVVHAHWKYVRQYDFDIRVCKCSHCGYEYQMLYERKAHQFVGDNFCSKCGAKMDEVEHE